MNSHRFTDAADVTEPAAAADDADTDADADAAEDGAGAGAGTVDEEEGAEEEDEEAGAGAALAEEPGRGGECMRATARGEKKKCRPIVPSPLRPPPSLPPVPFLPQTPLVIKKTVQRQAHAHRTIWLTRASQSAL